MQVRVLFGVPQFKMNSPVLFLDLDGVLNRSSTFGILVNGVLRPSSVDPLDPELIANLNLVTNHFNSGLKIVISSTWRKHHTKQILEQKLRDAGLTSFTVIGTTPVLHKRRGIEIRDWLLDNPEINASGKWCIVDDDNDMLPAQQSRFIKTSFDDGLTKELALKIINILENGDTLSW